MIRWFDHYLKGIDNGVDRDPTVRYYVMGAVGEKDAPGNVWRTAAGLARARQDNVLLPARGRQADGRGARPRRTSATTFLADPLHPNEIPGRAFPGAKDARDFEKQAEVRTFTTDVLTDPVEWTGKVQAELYVSSTAKDTDFIVRVSDVYPDGRSILLMDYVRRARYREGYEKEVFMDAGQGLQGGLRRRLDEPDLQQGSSHSHHRGQHRGAVLRAESQHRRAADHRVSEGHRGRQEHRLPQRQYASRMLAPVRTAGLPRRRQEAARSRAEGVE